MSEKSRTSENVEVEEGSGNVFRDLGLPDADSKQLRVELAVEIIRTVRKRGLSLRQSAAATGLAHSDVARLKKGEVRGFTIDRLVTVLNRLNRRVELRISEIEDARLA